MSRDPRVDAYIERQAAFAGPILAHLREAVHAACPEAEETIKWSMPSFLYRGGILATMAAFKQHATFGFWRGSEVVGESVAQRTAMGQFGRLTSLDDLPPDTVLAELIGKAVMLADSGEQPKRKASPAKAPLPVPDDLGAAIAACPPAAAAFDGFSPAARREYVEWILDAKQPATRARRIAQAVEWIAEGKKRNWKYESC